MQHSGKTNDIKLTEIKNAVRQMAILFGVKNEDRIIAYSYKLMDYKTSAIKKACTAMAETTDRFPSVADLLDQVRILTGQKDRERNTVDHEFTKVFEKEQSRLDEINKQFNERIGAEYRVNYIKAWFIGVYGKDALTGLDLSGIKLGAFEKAAMFDLSDAQMSSARAIEIGKRKLGRLE